MSAAFLLSQTITHTLGLGLQVDVQNLPLGSLNLADFC